MVSTWKSAIALPMEPRNEVEKCRLCCRYDLRPWEETPLNHLDHSQKVFIAELEKRKPNMNRHTRGNLDSCVDRRSRKCQARQVCIDRVCQAPRLAALNRNIVFCKRKKIFFRFRLLG